MKPRLVIVLEDHNVHTVIAEQPVDVLVLDNWIEGGPEERIKYGPTVYSNVTKEAEVHVKVRPRTVGRLFRLARSVTRYVENGGPLRHPLQRER